LPAESLVTESLLAAAPATGEPADSGAGEGATDVATAELADAATESLVKDESLAEAGVAEEAPLSGAFASASVGVAAGMTAGSTGFVGSTGCAAVGTGSPLAFLLPLPLLLF
jgi:hypothetical protein